MPKPPATKAAPFCRACQTRHFRKKNRARLVVNECGGINFVVQIVCSECGLTTRKPPGDIADRADSFWCLLPAWRCSVCLKQKLKDGGTAAAYAQRH